MANHQEQETREAGAFHDVEKDMPLLQGRLPPTLDKITSYLGKANPFAQPIDPANSIVWLCDNTAYQSASFPHTWQALFVAAFFEKDSGRAVIGKVVADITQKLGMAADGEDIQERIRERLQPFVDQILPSKTLEIMFKGNKGEVFKLGPSNRDGISHNEIKLHGHYDDMITRSGRIILGRRLDDEDNNMTTYFAGPTGWGVISDIDDTIKTTMTPSPLGILKSTFIDIPKPIPAMPSLYAQIARRLNPTWFYLSASPYNLYPFLHRFIKEVYPGGTLLLRDASWMDLAGFLASLTVGTQGYKVGQMDMIHKWLPKRKWLCIGDSTQTDPEAYGEIYRKYPGWVKKIFIRKVSDVAEMNETDKNSAERFEKAFKDVPRDVWQVFEKPVELMAAVDALQK